jgi:hypothetical protein
MQAIDQYGAGSLGTRAEFGTSAVHAELEREVAAFVGKVSVIRLLLCFYWRSAAVFVAAASFCLLPSSVSQRKALHRRTRLFLAWDFRPTAQCCPIWWARVG